MTARAGRDTGGRPPRRRRTPADRGPGAARTPVRRPARPAGGADRPGPGDRAARDDARPDTRAGDAGRGETARRPAPAARPAEPPRTARAFSGGRSARRGGGRPPRGPRRPAFRRSDPLKRLNAGLLVIAFVLSLFAGRLVQLQTIEADVYTARAVKQRLHELELPAVRGDITDADGHPLAKTVEARAVYADPALIEPAQRQRVVAALAPLLSMDPAKVLAKISTSGSRFVYLARGVSPDQGRMVEALDLPGVDTLPEYRRIYPNDDLAASVIGFVNREGRGGAGLESAYDRQLAGVDGWQRVETSVSGQVIPMGEDSKREPVPGRGLRLTLLRDVQAKAQQAIEEQVRATGARSGSVIVMDPRTGQILALATAPGYDPNDYGRADDWSNPIVQEAYEPGSTNKVITAAAVLEKGGVTPGTVFRVPYSVRRHDRTFHDSHRHPTQRLTFSGVLATSSNVGTILASETISAQTLYDYLRAFGFGEPTRVGLPGETAGVLTPPSRWSGTDRYPISFGQTVSVNALQMASVYATIANGGVRVSPQLIAGTVEPGGRFTAAPAPAQRRVISQATAEQIIRMLEGATTVEGTAPKARIPGYRVAGKTGTAEIVNPACGCYEGGGYTASFAGFAPADDPRLVVQVVLQKPTRGSHYGGDVAAPVFRDVMAFALKTRKIPPTGGRPPKIDIYARD
ncbi:peptidoglycan D,D-transpeptidase FtsI family protein [Thermomonospora cellulosilytica]|uniref:Cell division protein FtsI (Penicillin-binding protein 3) n=1 Tax=Thermomonospora cellulosilytica TaxID=1411118 RepID=A0A7W3N2S7_9ACTN|nr:penicillin-binding protein 2 [Thermomonospora cellulosilytica]MBA9006506.1 cell division protein FtsI (penicillin-binding protein 3) [Thermomonospora cellulosilytica]